MHELNLETRAGRLGRFGSLLAILAVTFTAGPMFSDEAQGVTGLSVLYTAVMLVSVYTVSHSRRVLLFGLALAVPAVAMEWVSNFVVTTGMVVANMVLAGTFIAYVIGVVFHEVLQEKRVTVDTIAGGIAVYLLFGVGWVTVYATIEYLHPGAFMIRAQTLEELYPEVQVRYAEFLYFSLVTLTTLGYGDMVPVIAQSRVATTVQAVVGQLYIAIFVARLVGLHLAEASSADRADD